MAGGAEIKAPSPNVNGKAEILKANFEPTAIEVEPLPPVLPENGVEKPSEKSRNIVLGRNVHSTSLTITEPEVNDEVTGDKEAQMAGVLARYRKNLMERTKYHLGTMCN